MFVLQVPPTSLIHEMATYNPCRVYFPYRTLSLHFYWGGKGNLDRNMEKPGISDHFPEET